MFKRVKNASDIWNSPASQVAVRYSESVGDHEFILKLIFDLTGQFGRSGNSWEIFSNERIEELWELHGLNTNYFNDINRRSDSLDSSVFITIGPIPEKAMNWLSVAFKDHGKRWFHFQTSKTHLHGSCLMGLWISSQTPCF